MNHAQYAIPLSKVGYDRDPEDNSFEAQASRFLELNLISIGALLLAQRP